MLTKIKLIRNGGCFKQYLRRNAAAVESISPSLFDSTKFRRRGGGC